MEEGLIREKQEHSDTYYCHCIKREGKMEYNAFYIRNSHPIIVKKRGSIYTALDYGMCGHNENGVYRFIILDEELADKLHRHFLGLYFET